MSLETKLIIVTAIFVLDWVYICFFKGASVGNKIYDEQLEEFNKGAEKNEKSVHSNKEQ